MQCFFGGEDSTDDKHRETEHSLRNCIPYYQLDDIITNTPDDDVDKIDPSEEIDMTNIKSFSTNGAKILKRMKTHGSFFRPTGKIENPHSEEYMTRLRLNEKMIRKLHKKGKLNLPIGGYNNKKLAENCNFKKEWIIFFTIDDPTVVGNGGLDVKANSKSTKSLLDNDDVSNNSNTDDSESEYEDNNNNNNNGDDNGSDNAGMKGYKTNQSVAKTTTSMDQSIESSDDEQELKILELQMKIEIRKKKISKKKKARVQPVKQQVDQEAQLVW